jgi:hypothetical protein
VVHTYNPSFSGCGNQEDCGLKLAWANSLGDSLRKTASQGRAGGVTLGVDLLQTQYHKKKKKLTGIILLKNSNYSLWQIKSHYI